MATRRPSKSKAVDPALSAFSTTPYSPFSDKYDIVAERKLLQELINTGDPDPADPLYPRFELFIDRERELRKMQADHAARQGADPIVAHNEAKQITNLGALVPGNDDIMTLHTSHAMRLFLGIAIAPGEQGYPSPGGKRVASCMRGLWSLSANDNPYADYALIVGTKLIDEVRSHIAKAQKQALAKLEGLRLIGLSYSLVETRSPAAVRLTFTSPYGFMIAMLIVEFDLLVRTIKSAQRRDLITGTVAYKEIEKAKSVCRSAFHKIHRYHAALMEESLIALSRLDFLPSADEAAKTRASLARAAMGVVPAAIFTGEEEP